MRVVNIEKGGEDNTNHVYDLIVMTDNPLPDSKLTEIRSLIESPEKTYPLTAKQIESLWNAARMVDENGMWETDKATYLKEHFNIDIN